MQFEVCTAENIKLEEMHNAMCDAFSDYDIPLQPSFAQFCDMLKLRQFCPKLSTLIIAESAVQSFWLIGRKGDRGHLAMSGTRPNARGKGFAKLLAEKTEGLLKYAGVVSIEFEVLTTNHKAISLYEKTGHKKVRLLDCFEFSSPQSTALKGISIRSTSFESITNDVSAFKEFSPSWQASNTAILAAGEKALCYIAQHEDKIVGFLVSNAKGSILQLAVDDEFRRQGIATLLLANFAKEQKIEKFSYVNVDNRDLATKALLQKFEGKQFAQQIELAKQL